MGIRNRSKEALQASGGGARERQAEPIRAVRSQAEPGNQGEGPAGTSSLGNEGEAFSPRHLPHRARHDRAVTLGAGHRREAEGKALEVLPGAVLGLAVFFDG